MSLTDYLRVLRRRALLIIVTMVLVGGAVAAWDSQRPKVYATSTQLIASVSFVGDVAGSSSRVAAGDAAQTLSLLTGTPLALNAAARAVGQSPGVVSSVTGTADGASAFLNIDLVGTDPSGLAAIANTFATTLPGVAADLDQVPAGNRIRLIVVRPAVANTVPISPRPARDVPIGAFLGLMAGVGLALLLRALDRQVRDSGDIEDTTDMSVLGTVPLELTSERLPARSHPASNRAESYRFLRTNLQFTDVLGSPRTVLVTSPAPGDGKTSLAANLGYSCALAGERTVIVDADLRRPRVAQLFDMESGPGLAELLETDLTDLSSYLHPSVDGLTVLTAGRPPHNPSELLARPSLPALIGRLSKEYDRVIIDAPPVLAVADALKIASNVSGVIIVARMSKTTVDELTTTRKRLEKTSVRLLGVVADGVVPGRDKAYGYGSFGSDAYGEHAYASEAPQPRRRRRRD